jgi:hypothetical protein
MIVVSDASPVISLAIAGRLDLLRLLLRVRKVTYFPHISLVFSANFGGGLSAEVIARQEVAFSPRFFGFFCRFVIGFILTRLFRTDKKSRIINPLKKKIGRRPSSADDSRPRDKSKFPGKSMY